MASHDSIGPAGARGGPAAPLQGQPLPVAHPALPSQPRPVVAPGMQPAGGYVHSTVPGQAVPGTSQALAGIGTTGAAPLPLSSGRAAVAVPFRTPSPAVPGKPGAAQTVRQAAQPTPDELEEDLGQLAIRNAPPWLISMAVHMLMLIIFALIIYVQMDSHERIVAVEVDPIYAEELGNQLEFDSPLGMDNVSEVQEPIITPDNLPQVEDPFAAPPNVEPQPDGDLAMSDLEANIIGLALKGREEGMKKTLLGKYGGTHLTQKAVLAGLRWLARQQRKDGSWSLAGPYSDGVPAYLDNPEAATAMALLAFQGDGHTHLKEGEFRRNVANGWRWLAKQQDADGNFYRSGGWNQRYYTQGMCAIAACELYGMTKDKEYKDVAERAIQNLIKAQAPEGGWRYQPNLDSDVSVTGWIVMALQSARMAGLEVPEESLRRVERFLDNVAQDDGAKYPYQAGGQVRLSMTAEALLCRQFLGWKRDDPRLVRGVEWIASNPVDFNKDRNVYYWYYATQVCHHMGHNSPHWKAWNSVMRQALPENQVPEGRKEAGSWDPNKPTPDQWGTQGGRLYVTCLSIYMLEVYYRHMPLYKDLYTDLLKSGRVPGR